MSTVLVSALVAAFVTLLVEYAAKPTFEARKDRILERHRQTRALLRLVRQVRCAVRDGKPDVARERLRELDEAFDASRLELRRPAVAALAAFADATDLDRVPALAADLDDALRPPWWQGRRGEWARREVAP